MVVEEKQDDDKREREVPNVSEVSGDDEIEDSCDRILEMERYVKAINYNQTSKEMKSPNKQNRSSSRKRIQQNDR